ncbi:MAG: hypothetical protein AAGC58_06595, partial [Asticcacaulis sp.]
ELKDARGRKRHKRSSQVAEKIAILRSSGFTVEQIAARLMISEPTLRKYYFRELTEGPELAKAVLIETMWKKALTGNVGAAKFIESQMEQGTAGRIARDDEKPEPQVKAPVIGKKEQAQRDAENVGGLFATPPPPKLVVSN